MKDITLCSEWSNLLLQVAEAEEFTTQFSGIKYLSDWTHSIPGEVFDPNRTKAGFDITDLGYAKGMAKYNSLRRVYVDQDSIKCAYDKITSRSSKEFTSVVINTQAGKKSSKSQGHCIAAIVVTRTLDKRGIPGGFRISVMYRMTEAIRKFAADLLFFRDELFPQILEDHLGELTTVGFHFANIALSPLFFPVLMNKLSMEETLELLKTLGSTSPIVFRSVCGNIRRDLGHESGFHAFRSRNLMHSLANGSYEAKPELKEALISVIMDKKED